MAKMVVEHESGRYEVQIDFCGRMFVNSASTMCPSCGGVFAWLATNDAGWDWTTHAGYSVEKYGRNPDEYRQMEAREAITLHFASWTHKRLLAERMQTKLQI